jgi:hypothetical protein
MPEGNDKGAPDWNKVMNAKAADPDPIGDAVSRADERENLARQARRAWPLADEREGLRERDELLKRIPNRVDLAECVLAYRREVEQLTKRCVQYDADYRREWHRVVRYREALERAVYIADHLFQMVPQSVWRDSGGDDMQGHYEGDYHAEKVKEELARLAALGDEQ